MHSCIYKLRPDVQSVVHAHPKFTIVMSVLQVPLVPMSQQGATLGPAAAARVPPRPDHPLGRRGDGDRRSCLERVGGSSCEGMAPARRENRRPKRCRRWSLWSGRRS